MSHLGLLLATLPTPTTTPAPTTATAAAHVLGLTTDQWQAVGVIVALLAVVVGTAVTWRGQQLDRKNAEATAARSEAAAALTEEYTRRVVTALEAMAAGGGLGVAPRRQVAWSLTHHGGDTYLLRNDGEATAHQVTIGADPSLHLVNVPGPGPIGPGEAVTFMAAVSMGTRDRTITVAWSDDQDEEPDNIWRYPLPARPPRP